jgi:hypothetical protein
MAMAVAVADAETGHRGRCRARGTQGRGLMGLKKGRETLTEKRGCSAAVCGALRLRCCGNGGNLLEWGGARESTVPFIIRYCRPEAVNDNDARARRGEGSTGKTRRAETRLAGTEKCTVAVAVAVAVAGVVGRRV